MAVEIIKNQPVSFHVGKDDFNTENKNCTQDNIAYCQSVRPEDTTMFQMRLTPINNENVITAESPFSLSFTGWYFGSGTWIYIGAAFMQTWGAYTVDDQAIIGTSNITIDTDAYYLVRYDITNMVNGYMELRTGAMYDRSGDFTADSIGSYVAYFRATTSAFSLEFKFNATSSGAGGAINNIEVVKLTQPTIYLANSSGSNVLDITDIHYYKDFVQATFDWPDVAEGTYTICVTGVDDLSFNYLNDSLCLGLENGGAILQESGPCIKWFG